MEADSAPIAACKALPDSQQISSGCKSCKDGLPRMRSQRFQPHLPPPNAREAFDPRSDLASGLVLLDSMSSRLGHPSELGDDCNCSLQVGQLYNAVWQDASASVLTRLLPLLSRQHDPSNR